MQFADNGWERNCQFNADLPMGLTDGSSVTPATGNIRSRQQVVIQRKRFCCVPCFSKDHNICTNWTHFMHIKGAHIRPRKQLCCRFYTVRWSKFLPVFLPDKVMQAIIFPYNFSTLKFPAFFFFKHNVTDGLPVHVDILFPFFDNFPVRLIILCIFYISFPEHFSITTWQEWAYFISPAFFFFFFYVPNSYS